MFASTTSNGARQVAQAIKELDFILFIFWFLLFLQFHNALVIMLANIFIQCVDLGYYQDKHQGYKSFGAAICIMHFYADQKQDQLKLHLSHLSLQAAQLSSVQLRPNAMQNFYYKPADRMLRVPPHVSRPWITLWLLAWPAGSNAGRPLKITMAPETVERESGISCETCDICDKFPEENYRAKRHCIIFHCAESTSKKKKKKKEKNRL